jgi:hypothetical protein
MLGKHIRLVLVVKEELMKLAFIALVVLTNLERLKYYIAICSSWWCCTLFVLQQLVEFVLVNK